MIRSGRGGGGGGATVQAWVAAAPALPAASVARTANVCAPDGEPAVGMGARRRWRRRRRPASSRTSSRLSDAVNSKLASRARPSSPRRCVVVGAVVSGGGTHRPAGGGRRARVPGAVPRPDGEVVRSQRQPLERPRGSARAVRTAVDPARRTSLRARSRGTRHCRGRRGRLSRRPAEERDRRRDRVSSCEVVDGGRRRAAVRRAGAVVAFGAGFVVGGVPVRWRGRRHGLRRLSRAPSLPCPPAAPVRAAASVS